MKDPLAVVWKLICAFCIATLLAEGGLLGLAWQRGWLKADRLQRAREAFYGVHRRAIRTRLTSSKSKEGAKDDDQTVSDRAMRISDLPLRFSVSRRDSVEIGVERNSLQIDQSRYEQTRIGFDRALDNDIKRLETAAIDAVQGLLEQLPPRAAKEHLMLMLTAPGDSNPKQAMSDVVMVLRRIAPDRRRKIFAEFSTPEESAQVEAMLRRIREVEGKTPTAGAAPASTDPSASPANGPAAKGGPPP
jgi:hypothetical protein